MTDGEPDESLRDAAAGFSGDGSQSANGVRHPVGAVLLRTSERVRDRLVTAKKPLSEQEYLVIPAQDTRLDLETLKQCQRAATSRPPRLVPTWCGKGRARSRSRASALSA
jgi:hypothetical protein